MAENSDNGPRTSDLDTSTLQDLPRYQQVAAHLMNDIETSKCPVGTMLPTEFELCEQFEVSRYTIREALRLLFEAGLVSRRRGAGTIVIATKQPPIFNHALDSIDDIIEYARETRLDVESIEHRFLEDEVSDQLSLPHGLRWIEVSGIRYKDTDPRPVCLIKVYIDTRLEGIQEMLDRPPRAIAEIIEDNFGVRVTRIEQTVTGKSLSAGEAKQLKADAGGAALKILRCYLNGEGEIVQVSESLYPAERVTLSMAFDRDGV
jgi:DNA-binding GntR family transcriptional regulator